jgi:hypothetical protein
MKLLRIFKGGGEDYDPRQHKTAVWKCDVCKYEHWEDHINEATFDKLAEKKCPKCGSYSVQDRIHALKLRKTELIQNRTKTDREIETTDKEIEDLCSRVESENKKSSTCKAV